MRRYILGLLAISLGLCAISPAFGASKLPPLGYQVMCLKHPEQCRGGGGAKVGADAEVMATLKRVNRHVNGNMKPVRDRSGVDVWTSNAASGDCEDFALTKRTALIRAGLPPSSLRLAYVKTKRGADHAVLVVKTDRGDLVLDNLTSAIRPLSQSGLRVVSIAGANPLKWS